VRIKSLTLHGFKSFADRTKVELHEGITAVVGPNGCGKSNISDALRWVLGEQRPTVIRGSRMDEAIFGGTEQRRPIHRAEVTLELTNEDGSLPVPYSEVLVGRTVYRGGESEYSLNSSPCRLRDVQDLCRDTGLGANAYAVIEGRMIDAILSDRAEERRALFEEAAAIGRYKDRRRVAMRRLEQAEGDLQRLEDVLVEVQSKVRSLAQQRGRAERQVKLRERLLRLEVAVADARLCQTAERLAGAERELDGLQSTQPSEQAELQTAETEAETLRIEQTEAERERARLARRLEEVRRALEQRERERLVAEERGAAARARLEGLAHERGEVDGRITALNASLARVREEVDRTRKAHTVQVAEEAALLSAVEALETTRDEVLSEADRAREALETVRREHDRFDSEFQTAADRAEEHAAELGRRRVALQELKTQESDLEKTIAAAAERGRESAELADRMRQAEAEARDALEAAQARTLELRDTVAQLEGDLSAARARASSLSSLLASGTHLPSVVSDLMSDPGKVPGVEAVLSECIEAPTEIARAVEAHLGPYLHGVIVRDWAAVQRVETWLEQQGAGEGVLLLPLDPGPTTGSANGDSPSQLLDAIEVGGAGAPWVRALLGGVALRTDERLAHDSTPWVGPRGHRQDRWGAVHLGRPGDADGVLSVRADLQGQHDVAERAETELARAREEAVAAGRQLRDCRADLEARETERRTAELTGRDHEAEREATEARLARVVEEAADVSRRIEQLDAMRTTAVELAGSGDDRRGALVQRLEEAEGAVSDASARVLSARDAAQEKRTALHELQLDLARAGADLEAREAAQRRLEETHEELGARAASLEEERAMQEDAASKCDQIVTDVEEEITTRLDDRAEWERKLSEAELRIADRRQVLDQREAGLREARRAEREHTDRRHSLELEVTQLRAARSSVHERLEAEWDASLDELRERVEPLEEGDLEGWDEELETVRRSIARLGPVNLLAQQEYDEEKERLEFLLEQKEDLSSARDDLRDSIRRINRSAAESFTDTFEQIRDNFQRTFQTLFLGGECNLWLEDPNDPLDSPIEISASPRGKRTQRIHLLSGGERALTALALLFAIYLVKPSPFCLMDEVDAPLDETNILRFVNMLQEFKKDTQFLIITHNARTIEAADWVYGVTMQEPGVSSIVGVQFEAAVPAEAAEPVEAAAPSQVA
jgi:chromosome segregation protein